MFPASALGVILGYALSHPLPCRLHPRSPARTATQFAFNTLQRVSPVSHGVCNVVKRVAIIGSSVVFFNQVLTTQAMVGTVIALLGTWLYTEMSSRHKHKKAPPPPAPSGGVTPAAA